MVDISPLDWSQAHRTFANHTFVLFIKVCLWDPTFCRSSQKCDCVITLFVAFFKSVIMQSHILSLFQKYDCAIVLFVALYG